MNMSMVLQFNQSFWHVVFACFLASCCDWLTTEISRYFSLGFAHRDHTPPLVYPQQVPERCSLMPVVVWRSDILAWGLIIVFSQAQTCDVLSIHCSLLHSSGSQSDPRLLCPHASENIDIKFWKLTTFNESTRFILVIALFLAWRKM